MFMALYVLLWSYRSYSHLSATNGSIRVARVPGCSKPEKPLQEQCRNANKRQRISRVTP